MRVPAVAGHPLPVEFDVVGAGQIVEVGEDGGCAGVGGVNVCECGAEFAGGGAGVGVEDVGVVG